MMVGHPTSRSFQWLAIIVMFLVLPQWASAQEPEPRQLQPVTFNLFYGSVTDVADGTPVVAKAGDQTFTTQVSKGAYGYDPAFTVEGEEGNTVSFFLDGKNVANTTIIHEGLTRLDLALIAKPTPDEAMLAEPEPQLLPAPIPTQSPLPPEAVQPQPDRTNLVPWFMFAGALLAAILTIGIVAYARKRRAPEPAEPALEYVRTMLQRGYAREQIATQMVRAGWSRAEVESFFQRQA